MRFRVLGLVIVLDEVVGEILSGGHICNCEEFRSGNCCVVVFGSSCDHSASLNLIIATCQVFRHLRTLEKTDDPRIQLALAYFEYAVGELARGVIAQRCFDGVDFTCHSKRTIRRKLLRCSIAITSPVSGTYKLFGKDLGNVRPVCFVIEGILAVALGSPRFFEFEVRRNCNCEELVGPFHKEGFSALGKVRIEQPSTGEAVRDVVDNVGGDLDPELGAILCLVDFGKSFIHRIFEVF